MQYSRGRRAARDIVGVKVILKHNLDSRYLHQNIKARPTYRASPYFADGVKKKIKVNTIKENGNYQKNSESRYMEGFGGAGRRVQSEP